jgi:hypothetical protein
MRFTREAVTVLLGLALLGTGCVALGPGADPPPSPAPASPADSATPPPGTQTTDRHQAALSQPDATKEVRLENAWNRTTSVRVRVTRDATNETVHRATYDVEPAERITVYNLSDADPDGIEPFTVAVTAHNATERVTIETNRCYGNVYGEIQDRGQLYLYYEIC